MAGGVADSHRARYTLLNNVQHGSVSVQQQKSFPSNMLAALLQGCTKLPMPAKNLAHVRALQHSHPQTNPLPLLFFPVPSLQQGPGWCLNTCDVLRKHGVLPPPHPTPPRQNVRQDSSGRSSACHRHRPQSNSMSQTQSAYPVVPVGRSASLSADTHAATPPAPRHRRGRLLDGVSTHVMLCGPGKLR